MSVVVSGESTSNERVIPLIALPFTVTVMARGPMPSEYERAYTETVSSMLPSERREAVQTVWVFIPTPVLESNVPEEITVPDGCSGVGAGAAVGVGVGTGVGAALGVGVGVNVGGTLCSGCDA